MQKYLLSDYAFYDDLNLLLEVHKGTVVPGSLTNFKTLEMEDPKFSADYNIIADFRAVSFEVTLDLIMKFTSFLVANKHKLAIDKRVAVLYSTLNQQIYISFYASMQDKLKERIKLVKTIEEAVAWVDGPYTEMYIQKELEKLAKSPKIKCGFKADY